VDGDLSTLMAKLFGPQLKWPRMLQALRSIYERRLITTDEYVDSVIRMVDDGVRVQSLIDYLPHEVISQLHDWSLAEHPDSGSDCHFVRQLPQSAQGIDLHTKDHAEFQLARQTLRSYFLGKGRD
jgi:hypothetical protein